MVGSDLTSWRFFNQQHDGRLPWGVIVEAEVFFSLGSRFHAMAAAAAHLEMKYSLVIQAFTFISVRLLINAYGKQ